MLELIQLSSFTDLGSQLHNVKVSQVGNQWRVIEDNSLPSHCQASIQHICNAVKAYLNTSDDVIVQCENGDSLSVIFPRSSRELVVVDVADLIAATPTVAGALTNAWNSINTFITE